MEDVLDDGIYKNRLQQPDFYCPIIRDERPRLEIHDGRKSRSAQAGQFLHHNRDGKGLSMRRIVCSSKMANISFAVIIFILASLAFYFAQLRTRSDLGPNSCECQCSVWAAQDKPALHRRSIYF